MMCSLNPEARIPAGGSKALKYNRLERAELRGRHDEIEGLASSSPRPGGSNIGENDGGSRRTGCTLVADQGLAPDSHERAAATTKLTRAIVVCVVFMVLETVGGQLAGSLAVLADAAHMLLDVAGFSISLLALRASSWMPTAQKTFGYFRLEVLGALLSVQIIWVMTGIILYEAFHRLYHGIQVVDGRLMFFIACAGLALSFIVILVLGHGHDHSGVSHEHGHGDDRHLLVNYHNHNHELDSGIDSEDDRPDGRILKFGQGNSDHKHGIEKPRELEERYKQSASQVELHAGGAIADDYIRGSEALLALTGEDSPLRGAHDSGDNPFEYDAEITNTVQPGREVSEDEVERQGFRAPKDGININLRGAYIHAIGDLIQNAGVFIAGAVIWFKPEWHLIDPLCSVVFSVIVLVTTIKMLKDITWVLMESSSADVDVEMLKSGLLQISGVSAVADLHVWALTPGTNLLTCHLEIGPGAIAREVLHDATEYCHNLHQIKHVTIQIEEDPECATTV